MALNNNLGIGGTEVKLDAFEAFQEIQANKVLMAEKLTDMPPVKPEIVEGLTNVEAVFEHYKPKVDMTFENEDGVMVRETLHFKNLGDYGVKGITAQSKFLGDLNAKREQYQKIIKQLKTNKLLKTALAEGETRESLIQSLELLLGELKSTK
jgi:hypothetical protein